MDKKDNPIWKHHQMNVDNKTYVKNDDGTISTVFTTILGDGEREYLIPKVWDGEILSDEDAWERAMSSGIEWPSAVSSEEGIRHLEQLDEELHKDMRGYAEGGEVMTLEKQMSLFEEGGLADDGMTREPVTGNEIPPGSMAKEVRDDVPAQLSEGEYVVPADVVRYYGVKFFEDLRQEAKGGMMEMEQEGRIGGTAVDINGVPVEDDNLTPEEERMLMEALAADRPQAMAKGGVVKGYAEGGQVFQPSFTGQVSPYGMTNAYGGSGFEARQYVNTSTGQIRTFQFLNGMPVSMIPEGFVPATQEAIAAAGKASDETKTGGTGVATGDVEKEGRGFDPEKDLYGQTDSAFDKTTSEGSMAAADKGLSKANFSDPLGTAKTALEGKGTVGKIAGTVLGGLFAGPMGAKIGGALGQNAQMMGGITEAAVNSEIAGILGYDTTSIDSAIEGKIAGMGKLGGTAATNAAQNARAAAKEAVFSVDSPFALTEDKFQSKEAFDKAMEYGAPAGMSYDPTVTADFDIGGGKTATVEGGYSREGSAAPETSSRPQAPTGNVAATRAANDAKAAADMSGEGPGGGGGDTVICTALHNLGRLESKIYSLDKEYGLALEKTNPELLQGYRKLATPLADYIQEDTLGAKIAREIVTPFAKAWAKEMAHTLRPEEYKGSLLGKTIMFVGYPVCAFVGKKLKGIEYAI